jgi:hypothetical protein
LEGITDEVIIKLCSRNNGLKVLELCKCSSLTITSIDTIIRILNHLQTININMIPKIKLNDLNEALEEKPWVQVIQLANKLVSDKDNGLRIPLPPKPKEVKVKK